MVDKWAAVNKISEIRWAGTWVGGPDLMEPAMAMAAASAPPDEMSMDAKADAIRSLAKIAKDLPFPTTLLEIARTREV